MPSRPPEIIPLPSAVLTRTLPADAQPIAAAVGAVPRRLGYALERVDEHPPEAPAESGRRQIWVRRTP